VTDTRFDRKTAIVTGAAGNIGRAVCQRLSSEGAAVLAVDRDQAGLDETVGLVNGTAVSRALRLPM
jgi:NAD(P)-dependent dehydrogenase (short-subunit alcohol dehydrogenase family)